MKTKTISKFLFSYYYAGAWWNLEIPAYNKEDAQLILNKLPLAKFDGILIQEIKFIPYSIAHLIQRLTRWAKKQILAKRNLSS